MPGGGEPAWHQRWWAIAGAMLSVLLVGCVLGSLVAVLTNSDSEDDNGTAVPTTAPNITSPSPTGPGASGSGGLGPGEERTGSGPAIVALDLPADAVHTVTITHTGEGFFHARLLNSDGDFARSLGSGSGEFSGTYPVELQSFGDPDAVDIVDGDGSWTVRVGELADAPQWPDQTTGTGPAVLQVSPDIDVSTVSFSYVGEGNVFVYGYVEDEFDDLMVNEIGDWSGEVDLRPDTFALEIDASGEWSVEPD